jgi:glutathione S-transferase
VLPVLQLDDGTYIAESTAITEYLDNLDGDPKLTGKTPREKAVIHMMQKRAETELLDAVGDYFHHATPGLGADLQVFKSPEWAGRQEWGNRQRDRALKGMKYFDTVLRKHSFVAGDAFSMADITVFAGLMFVDAAGIVVPEDHSALNAWRAKVADLPSVKNRSGQMFVADDLRRLGF